MARRKRRKKYTGFLKFVEDVTDPIFIHIGVLPKPRKKRRSKRR